MLPSLYKNIILQKENTVHLFKNTYTSIYEDEHVLDNIYKIKNFKKLEWIYIGNLKVNEDIKAMFPNAKVFID